MNRVLMTVGSVFISCFALQVHAEGKAGPDRSKLPGPSGNTVWAPLKYNSGP